MGDCISKTAEIEESNAQKSNIQNQKSTLDSKNVAGVVKTESLVNAKDFVEDSREVQVGGLKIRYAYMSQRGFYPDGKLIFQIYIFSKPWNEYIHLMNALM